MAGKDLVFIGIDVVAEAIDVAETRRWRRVRAPSGLWRRLGTGTGVLLSHPDAPFHVAVVPADSSVRGVCKDPSGRLRICDDDALFDELVDDSPVVEELIHALLGSDSAVRAA